MMGGAGTGRSLAASEDMRKKQRGLEGWWWVQLELWTSYRWMACKDGLSQRSAGRLWYDPFL